MVFKTQIRILTNYSRLNLLLVPLVIVGSAPALFAQIKLKDVESRVAILEASRLKLQDSLKKVDDELKRLEGQRELLEYRDSKRGLSKRYFGKIARPTYISSKPLFGETTPIAKGEAVEMVDLVDRKIKVYAGKRIGYIWQEELESSSDLDEFLNSIKMREMFREEEKELKFDSLKAIHKDSSMYVVRVVKGFPYQLRDSPNGKVVRQLVPMEPLLILTIAEWSLEVVTINDQKRGFISHDAVDKSTALVDAIRVELERRNNEEKATYEKRVKDEQTKERARIKEQEKKDKAAYEKRKARLTAQYGVQITNRILGREYWIGMSASQARESLGSPDRINESVGSWGTHEQWVYNGFNLYFENGVLKSYQTSR